jgi:hypothetical protein
MSDALNVPELPFPTTPSRPGVWRRDRPSSAVVAAAPAHTDLYLDPGGADAADAGSMINAATLLGTPPPETVAPSHSTRSASPSNACKTYATDRDQTPDDGPA